MERPDILTRALAVLFCFLLGSIPFGLLFTRARGINLREVGSGNIGATNVMRAAGKGMAGLTLLGDLLKGTAAVAIGKLMGGGTAFQGVMGLAAVAGHDFSMFLKFRGGKGVATSLGVLLLYTPLAGILTMALWLGVVGVTKISSVGALVSFAFLPVGIYLLGYPQAVLYVSLVLSSLLFVRHTANIKRIMAGTEGKIDKKP